MIRPSRVDIREVVALSTAFLRDCGSDSPRLDAEILAAHALGLRRLDLYLYPDRPLTEPERDRLRGLVRRRAGGEPVAYLTGTRDFHGITLRVSPAVLIPRPETEVLVDACLDFLAGRTDACIADAGTGSGAVACAIAASHPTVRVVATDMSAEALAVAAGNVAALGLQERVSLVQCDLVSALGPGLDAVVSNPPYIGERERAGLDRSVRDFEPAIALFSGPYGMEATTRLVEQATTRVRAGGILVVEVGVPDQRDAVERLLRGRGAWMDVTGLRDAGRVVRAFRAVRRAGE